MAHVFFKAQKDEETSQHESEKINQKVEPITKTLQILSEKYSLIYLPLTFYADVVISVMKPGHPTITMSVWNENDSFIKSIGNSDNENYSIDQQAFLKDLKAELITRYEQDSSDFKLTPSVAKFLGVNSLEQGDAIVDEDYVYLDEQQFSSKAPKSAGR